MILLAGKIGLPAGEALPDVLRSEFFTGRAVLVIGLQSMNDHSSLGVGEELGVVREVLDDPEGYEPCHHRRKTLQNEYPRPTGFPADPVHFRKCSLLGFKVNKNSGEGMPHAQRTNHRMRLIPSPLSRKSQRGCRIPNVCTN